VGNYNGGTVTPINFVSSKYAAGPWNASVGKLLEMVSDGLGRSGTNCWLIVGFWPVRGPNQKGFATAGVGSSGPHPTQVIEHPNQLTTSNWSQRISKLALIAPQAFGGPSQLGVQRVDSPGHEMR
jgi:hypothetical protein